MTITTLYIASLGGNAASFEKYYEKFSTNYKDLIKISIADGDHHKVPDHRIKAIFREISALPNLREIKIDPAYCSEFDGFISSTFISWLLSSKDCKIEKLGIKNLEVDSDSEVEEMALALKGCPSIKELCIDQIVVGYRNVKTLLPLMEVIAQLPNLVKVRLAFDAFGKKEASVRYASESLPVLKRGAYLEGAEIKTEPGHPEISNCNDLCADL